MPRTLDPTAYALRRDAFLDAAERLMRTKGYEQMTIQDVLEALDTSKGALYHYFDSKQALLEAVVERVVDGVLAVVEPIADEEGMPAAAKLQAFLTTAAAWKTERSDLLLALTRAWYSGDNDLVRLRVARAATERLAPVLARIVRQGVTEGTFDPRSPEQAAHMLVALFNGSAEHVGRLALNVLDGRTAAAEMRAYLDGYAEAIERILGLSSGSLTIVDEPTLHAWFD